MTDGKSYGETTPDQEGKTFPEPTAQEAHFFFNILKHQKSKPEIDWAAVAEASGFKNADVAKVCLIISLLPLTPRTDPISQVRFGQVKKKLGLDSGVATKSPVRGSSKKGGKSISPGDDALGANTTGTKVEKKATRKRAPTKSKDVAQAHARFAAIFGARPQAHNQAAVIENDVIKAPAGGVNVMAENAFPTHGFAKTEDQPVKQEYGHSNNVAMTDSGHVKDEHGYLPGIHGLPAISTFRAEQYRPSPLNYSSYGYTPDEDHDV